jgi:hypothetical protein
MSTLKPSPHRAAATTLAQRLRILAHRGHQVTAKDLATLVRAAALLEEQGAAIDRHLSVYGQTLGELVETRHQLVSIREMLTEALEGEACGKPLVEVPFDPEDNHD